MAINTEELLAGLQGQVLTIQCAIRALFETHPDRDALIKAFDSAFALVQIVGASQPKGLMQADAEKLWRLLSGRERKSL